MVGAVLSKSVIQLSLDFCGAVFSPCYLTRDQTMVEVMKKMATSFRRSSACRSQCPNSEASHRHPMPLPGTPGLTGKSGSVSCGVTPSFSWVLVCTSFCLYPPRIYFPSPVCSGSSMVELMATSSKRAYAIPRSAAPRAPAPAAVHG